jgi:hypothetical protein
MIALLVVLALYVAALLVLRPPPENRPDPEPRVKGCGFIFWRRASTEERDACTHVELGLRAHRARDEQGVRYFMLLALQRIAEAKEMGRRIIAPQLEHIAREHLEEGR